MRAVLSAPGSQQGSLFSSHTFFRQSLRTSAGSVRRRRAALRNNAWSRENSGQDRPNDHRSQSARALRPDRRSRSRCPRSVLLARPPSGGAGWSNMSERTATLRRFRACPKSRTGDHVQEERTGRFNHVSARACWLARLRPRAASVSCCSLTVARCSIETVKPSEYYPIPGLAIFLGTPTLTIRVETEWAKQRRAFGFPCQLDRAVREFVGRDLPLSWNSRGAEGRGSDHSPDPTERSPPLSCSPLRAMSTT